MYGRPYVASWENQAITAAVDLFEFLPAGNIPVRLHHLLLTQGSDVGDVEEEMLRIKVIRGYTTGGSGGAVLANTTDNIYLLENDDPAACVVEGYNDTLATGGTAHTLFSAFWNIRLPFDFAWLPKFEPTVQGTRIVVRLMVAPNDSLNISATAYYSEGS